MAQFKIYGDYGYTTETLLEEFDSRAEAIRWAEDYARQGGFGGYKLIEVAWHDGYSGEYIIERAYHAEDWEEQFYEGDDDFALIDEF